MSEKMTPKFFIFTDGASRGNPGPGGWGTIVVEQESEDERGGMFGKVTELGGSEDPTTNNRMELQAVIGGLNSLASKPPAQILIYTDSSYVLRGATEWLAGWQAKNWRTSTKTDVLNKDLWQQLSTLLKEAKNSGNLIRWHLLSGHVGVAGNERADKIATAFADKKSAQLFTGSLADYQRENNFDILNISADAEQKEKRSGSKERSRAKAYSYISKVGGKVMIHQTWAECEARVRGVSAARFKKSLNAADEQAIVKEFEGI